MPTQIRDAGSADNADNVDNAYEAYTELPGTITADLERICGTELSRGTTEINIIFVELDKFLDKISTQHPCFNLYLDRIYLNAHVRGAFTKSPIS